MTLRADAERNRRRLLDAAAAAFAEHGLDVSVAEIARRAELGKGTVFRRFPTKDHLIAAIFIDRLGGLVARGRALLDNEDPGDALREWIRATVQLMTEDRGLLEAASAPALEDAGIAAVHDEFLDVTGLLLARAQERGAVRDDVTGEDIAVLAGGICQASARLHAIVPRVWERYVDLVFDGLRPEAAHPPSQPPPTRKQIERAVAANVKAGRGR